MEHSKSILKNIVITIAILVVSYSICVVLQNIFEVEEHVTAIFFASPETLDL